MESQHTENHKKILAAIEYLQKLASRDDVVVQDVTAHEQATGFKTYYGWNGLPEATEDYGGRTCCIYVAYSVPMRFTAIGATPTEEE